MIDNINPLIDEVVSQDEQYAFSMWNEEYNVIDEDSTLEDIQEAYIYFQEEFIGDGFKDMEDFCEHYAEDNGVPKDLMTYLNTEKMAKDFSLDYDFRGGCVFKKE